MFLTLFVFCRVKVTTLTTLTKWVYRISFDKPHTLIKKNDSNIFFLICGMLTFTNPKGLYQLEYPRSFHVSYENEILTIAPPNNNSCLTISNHHFINGINDIDFASLFQKLTLKYEPIQNPIFISKDILLQRLKNVRPDETGTIITTYWTICIFRKENNLLVITVNVPGEESSLVFDEYEKMLNSITM